MAIYTLPTAHVDNVGEAITAALLNNAASAINEISGRRFTVPRWKTGRWYSIQQEYGAGFGGSLTLTVNEIYATPLLVPIDTAIDQVGVRVATGVASSTLRLMAHAEGTDGHPGALLFDWGTVASDTSGDKIIAISATLPAGIVWLSCVSNGAAIVGTFGAGSTGFAGNTSQAGGDCAPHRANGSQTAPNPFGTTAITYITDNFLRLAVRAA